MWMLSCRKIVVGGELLRVRYLLCHDEGADFSLHCLHGDNASIYCDLASALQFDSINTYVLHIVVMRDIL